MTFAASHLFGMVALSGATEVSLSLDVRYSYKLFHTGVDVSGNDDANSAKSAWLSTVSATITCDGSVEDHKLEMKDGTNETIGPGISMLYLKSTADADAVIKLYRIGTPTNSY
jgi:hypothetical protein